jgi:hypothetical protein
LIRPEHAFIGAPADRTKVRLDLCGKSSANDRYLRGTAAHDVMQPQISAVDIAVRGERTYSARVDRQGAGRAGLGSLPAHTRLGNGLGRFGRLGAPESGGRWALIQAFAAAGPLSQTSCGALAKTSS